MLVGLILIVQKLKEKMNNKISVIMGIYNCEKTLPEAIDSIINQTYENWELIMCDDCSADNTYEIARKYKEQYPNKIILIKNETNSKLAYSLNQCLKKATGYYVARMDGDDISLPNRFEKQVEYLNSHPNIQLVGTNMQLFNDSGYLGIEKRPEHTDKWTLHKIIPFNHATIMTYKNVYDDLDGYTVCERTVRGQDYDLWFRFFHKGYMGDNIQEPLYLVREDINAVKRRSFKVRWSTFETTKFGYKLLGYPKIWLFKEFLLTFVKSITPYKIQYLYKKTKKIEA